MAQASVKKEYNTFVKGIITEAGPLTYPENASIDEENCVLNRDGSRQRRLGMDYESGFALRKVTVDADDAITCHRWYNVANDASRQFAVVQAGARLLVFDAYKTSVSANLIANIDISAYVTGKTALGTASGMGYFFVVGGANSQFYLSYNPDTKAVTLTSYVLEIRDLLGVDDGTDVDTRPGGLSATHHYNLLNQGWPESKITAYHTATGLYPSNAQQWWLGKDANEDFDPALLDKQDFGTTPAPKGRFVIDAFARSTSRQGKSGIAVPTDIETGYPTVAGFAFGRVFYAGCKSSKSAGSEFNPNYTGFIFYSRIIRSTTDFGVCYGEADPSSEVFSDVLDTDGGYINIPNSGQIYKLMSKGDSMLVFAERGIWAITGDDGGFRGTSYQVQKISSFGVLSGSSVVDVEDKALYWNRGGIYAILPDQSTGFLSVNNITQNTIQTLFNSIDQPGKVNAVGSFDPVNRKVSWMYNDSEDYDGVTYKNKYNREIVLDLVLEAFYKNSLSSIEDPSPYIAGYLETPDFLLRNEGVRTRGDSVTKYLVVQFFDRISNNAALSFAYYRDPSFRDWRSANGAGVPYTSYLITGWETLEDTMRNKTAQKLVTHFKRTELTAVDNGDGQAVPDNPSSCFLQTRWDWTDSANSGKWSESFQVYRPRPYVLTIGEPIDYGYEVITNKTTVPGRGKALSIKFVSEGDKDFYLYGWAIKFTGQTSV